MIICKKMDRYFKKRKIIFSFKIIKSGCIKQKPKLKLANLQEN